NFPNYELGIRNYEEESDFIIHNSSFIIYKTGDLVRWLTNGSLEFIGRTDHQVKIRGFRIELGEIETLLQQHEEVQETAVLVHQEPSGNKQLIAYVVSTPGANPTASTLYDFLKNKLPIYMLPAAFVMLPQMPRLPNGKLNRHALPAPDETDRISSELVLPRNATEEIIAGIWAELLNRRQVSIHDDFHQLGGHSLLATQIISRLRRAFQVDIPIRSLFEHPTVAGLAQLVRDEKTPAAVTNIPFKSIPRDGKLPLSYAQQQLWFLEQLEPGNLFYNLISAVRLTGVLDREALQQSLQEMVRRHESLRTTFITENGRPRQLISSTRTIPVVLDDFTHLPDSERMEKGMALVDAEAKRPFDLAAGPLLRLRLVRLADDDYIAIIAMHHIISDGWSMSVFIQELTTLYAAYRTDRPSPLTDLPLQYADYAHWQEQWLQGETLAQQLDYWKKQLHNQPLLIDLPTDYPRPAVQTSNGATATFTLSPTLTNKLNAFSRAQGATLFMTLLAAYQILLSRYARQEDISVGTAVANRSRPEIEGLIGFFVNTLVIRTDLAGRPSFKKLLQRVLPRPWSAPRAAAARPPGGPGCLCASRCAL
ncbi:MAG: condensation domain-containing protein, partial [Anaerolineae bacterium]